jgi:hypothetical protein
MDIAYLEIQQSAAIFDGHGLPLPIQFISTLEVVMFLATRHPCQQAAIHFDIARFQMSL